MNLIRFDPFSLMSERDRCFEGGRAETATWCPRVDAFDRDSELVIRVEVPGIDPADVEITVEDRTLTITGTRSLDETVAADGYHRREIRTGDFKRTLVLPKGLDTEEISARADHGMLEISLPRRPEVLPRKVKVDVAS